MVEDKKYWVALNSAEIGSANLRNLYHYFKNMEKAWQARDTEYLEAGIRKNIIEKIKQKKRLLDIEREWKRIEELGIGVVTFKEDNFPAQLNLIPDPPAIIYIRGKIIKKDEISLGIVGTRRISLYGRQVTEKLAEEISISGVTIISGLARGVDTIAHKTALENNGRTIAVLGSGIDDETIYPWDNLELAHQIIKNGAIISEFHPNTPPLQHHFPMRNRIIAGLSLALLVTECPLKSGALITARLAVEQGRDVFAVPGDIRYPNSEGTNNLIKIGAKAITSGEEILDELDIKPKKRNNRIIAKTIEEKKILEQISKIPKNIDKISRDCGIKVSEASSILTMMEIKGIVRNVGMNEYITKDN